MADCDESLDFNLLTERIPRVRQRYLQWQASMVGYAMTGLQPAYGLPFGASVITQLVPVVKWVLEAWLHQLADWVYVQRPTEPQRHSSVRLYG